MQRSDLLGLGHGVWWKEGEHWGLQGTGNALSAAECWVTVELFTNNASSLAETANRLFVSSYRIEM